MQQASAGCKQNRLGPEPPLSFLRQVGPRHKYPIALWQWHRNISRRNSGRRKAMKSKTKRCRVCLAERIFHKEWKTYKTTWVCKGCPGEPDLAQKKDALNCTIPSLF